jgi:hypothetical protein
VPAKPMWSGCHFEEVPVRVDPPDYSKLLVVATLQRMACVEASYSLNI